ncbi:endonuclease/exonuclease/phosphatase family protein, partial [Candidatus Poribacteria bacterium]|nr:endonuclease/exonuclease/phosphatase family protein [Candidatus Poribacteria bacterium]
EPIPDPPADGSCRIATYNIRQLYTALLTNTDEHGAGRDPRIVCAARIIQRVRPDVLLVLEIDHDYTDEAEGLDLNARRFVRAYLDQGPGAIDYPYIFAAPCNTGILSGLDLNNDGKTATPADLRGPDYPGDCFGFGEYPGQYSMAVLSRYPILTEQVRTMQKFLWRDLPGNHLPEAAFLPEAIGAARLSSKSHWDVPFAAGGGRLIHILASHPTPQGFNAPEDRNGRRNFDEIKLWAEYLKPDGAVYDDAGVCGGLAPGSHFVILGDMNAPETFGTEYDGMRAIDQLLCHPLIQNPGAMHASAGALRGHAPGPQDCRERWTHGMEDGSRSDYVLPSRSLRVTGGGVYWPAMGEDFASCIMAEHASDHRLVWVDVAAG